MWAMVVCEHVANINGVEKDLFFQFMQTTSQLKVWVMLPLPVLMTQIQATGTVKI